MNVERRGNSEERGTKSDERRNGISTFPVQRSSFIASETGFSLIEVMVAMVITAFGLLGAMALFQVSDQGLRDGGQGLRALALAQSRLEAKRIAPWNLLLQDDVNADGIVDVTMRDDGAEGDLRAGDGVYTGMAEQAGVSLLWTVRPDQGGSLARAGAVVIEAKATYRLPSGRIRTVNLATLRANPNYVGQRT